MKRLVTSTLLMGMTGFGYASLIERNAFVLRRWRLPVLPVGAAPVTVLHISDIHLVPRQRRKLALVQALAAQSPDLVVNTGDNLAHPEAVPDALEMLAPLQEFPGVFVLGSNDYFAPRLKNPAKYLGAAHRDGLGKGPALPTEQLQAGLLAGGWVDLRNRRHRMLVGGLAVEFIGVDDPHLELDDLDAIAHEASGEADLTIGVTHAPYQRVLDTFTEQGARLLFAGHTHGGQLCVPAWGALVTNCDLDARRAKGVSRWWPGAGSTPSAAAPPDAGWLHVCAGLGTSPFAPVRFACRPEASLLTLVARE